MRDYLNGFICFITLFVLWECGQGSDPVLPNQTQIKRLLTGGGIKTWIKIKSGDKESGILNNSDNIRWVFSLKDTTLTIEKGGVKDTTWILFSVDTLQGASIINFKLISPKQFAPRRIVYITEREMVCQQYGFADSTEVETFKKN